MGRLIRTLENRTALLFFLLAAALSAVTLGLCLLAEAHSAKQVQIQVCDRMLAAAGRLSQSTGASDEAIAAAFTKKGTDEAELGERVLSEHGFEAGTGRGFEYAYSKPVLPSVIAALAVLLCAAAGLCCFMHLFKQAKAVTGSAKKREKLLCELSDRELVLLADQVNGLISERERTVKQMSDEKVRLAQYLQDFSHQIKTPAAGLTLNNEIYRTHPMNPEEMNAYLDRDRVCIERISKLCSESLKLARLQAGTVQYSIKKHSLSDIVQRACAPLYELAAKNGTELVEDIPQDAELDCDGLWLCEAVSNLAKNACEHTHGGKVTVSAKQTPLSTEITITDNGEGIADSDIPELFRRFYSKSNDTDPSAVGIGMSIAKHITEDMGGKMYIDSELGRGTRIRLEFLG